MTLTGEPLGVLLVDDHRIFADVLAQRMKSEPTFGRVDVAHSVSEARANLLRHPPDVVFLDAQLDGEPGTDLFVDLKALPHPPDVLMLSGHTGVERVVAALRAGAQGWVSKTVPFDTLVFAVDEVRRGNMYLRPPQLKPVLVHLLARSATDVIRPSFVDGLTPRQLDVLRCLVDGMSRAECAERLFLSVHTVRTHVQHLLKRADVHSTLALAARARELGVEGIDQHARAVGHSTV